MNVLVVDDDVVARMMLMHLVDSCGAHDIAEAEDGEDAWAQLAAGLRPHIVFCDLRMPRLSGMELLVRVRTDPALAGTPFVLVSAASDAATMAQAARCDASGYLVKPFTVQQVREQLARAPGPQPAIPPDEDPAHVARRLGIFPERLLVYLAGLQRQLEQAGSAGTLAPEQGSTQLLRLAEGCATLGLAGAAAQLAVAAGGGPAGVQEALAFALASARTQAQRVQG